MNESGPLARPALAPAKPEPRRIKLSKRLVDAASRALPPRGAVVTWDTEAKGLGLRVRASGVIRWVFRYRLRTRQRWVVIGEPGQPWTVDSARARAAVLQGEVAAGRDPAARRDLGKAVPTLEVAATTWIREHAQAHKAPASVEGDRFLLARLKVAYVDFERGEVGDLGRTRVDAVSRDQVAAMHRRMKGTPTQANRAVALLSAIFSHAGRVGADNPCRGIHRYREERRERFLSPDELGRLGHELAEVERLGRKGLEGGESKGQVAGIRLLLFTGARLGELLKAKRSDVDLRAGTLRVARPKEGKPKLIRLGPPAVAIIKALPRRAKNPWLLVGHVGGSHLVNLHDTWARIRARAGLDDVRLHDLRHSFAAIVAAGGASLPVIGALLGHRSPQTTLRYVHFGADPLRTVVDGAAIAIEAALKGKARPLR